MRVTNADVEKQLVETRKKMGYMVHFLKYAPLVGFVLNAISRQQMAAVHGVAGATSTLTKGRRGYKLVWNRWGNRLTINHHGHWKSEAIDESGKSHHVMSKGKLPPLHDPQWAKQMTAEGHGRTYPKKAVEFFAKLLPVTA